MKVNNFKKPDKFYQWLSVTDLGKLNKFWTVDDNAVYTYWLLNVAPKTMPPRPKKVDIVKEARLEHKAKMAGIFRDINELLLFLFLVLLTGGLLVWYVSLPESSGVVSSTLGLVWIVCLGFYKELHKFIGSIYKAIFG